MKRLPRRDHVKPDEASRIAWTVIRSSCKFRSNAESVLGYCNDPVPEFRVVECLFFVSVTWSPVMHTLTGEMRPFSLQVGKHVFGLDSTSTLRAESTIARVQWRRGVP